MQVMYHLCSKNMLPSKHSYIQLFRLNYKKYSDVVETVTSETETWLKFRDETETESLS